MAKKVLVPMAVGMDEKSSLIYMVRPTYLKALEHVGLEPVLVSNENTEMEVRKCYESCNGVMFIGGWDVDPKQYGERRDVETKVIGPKRDELELKILNWASEDKKPFLGICRGLEILNVFCGGSLHSHLSNVVNEKHSVGGYEHLGEVRHNVVFEDGSLLRETLGEEIETNTGHHQAIKKLGDGLRVAGKTVGGVIEAVEGVDKYWFALGVQWHPEADLNDDSNKIFKLFALNIDKWVL